MDDDLDWARLAPPLTFELEDCLELAHNIVVYHAAVIKRNGGFSTFPVFSEEDQRDKELEEKILPCVFAAFAVEWGETPAERYGYTDIFDQVSRFAYLLAKDHVFGDGNKRTALKASLGLIYSRGIMLQVYDLPDPENNVVYEWIVKLVSGDKSCGQMAELLRGYAIPGSS